MATNNVNLGIGNVTGMVYTAPAGTSLPTSAADSLTSWTELGAVSSDGIVWAGFKDSEPLRNWARIVERLVSSDEGGTVKVPLIYTVKKVFEAIFGSSNVTYTAATSAHGNVTKVTVAPGVSASPAAWLFVMKDGDDMIFLGTENGIARDVDDVTFAPTEGITWNTTIEASSWTLLKDDGQLTS